MSSGAGFDGPGVVEVVPESPTRLGSPSSAASPPAPAPAPGPDGVSVRRERLIRLVVALVVACITYPALIPDVGWELDHSWAAALHMAHAQGLVFGRDIVFTYGPLGWLTSPTMFYEGTGAIAIAVRFPILVAVAYVIWRRLRLLTSMPVSFIGCVALAWMIGSVFLIGGETPLLVVFAVLGAYLTRLAAPASTPVPRWVPGALGALGALMLVIKFDTGVSVAAWTVFIVVAEWLLYGQPVRRALIAAVSAVGSFVLALVVLWVACGQRLAYLGTWLDLSLSLFLGFNDAMAQPGYGWELQLAFASMAGLVVLVRQRGVVLDRRRAQLLWLALIASAFVFAKQAFLRHDSHSLRWWAFVGFAVLVLGVRKSVLVGTFLVVPSVIVAGAIAGSFTFTNPTASIRAVDRALGQVTSHAERRQVREWGRSILPKAHPLPEEIVAAIKGDTVHIAPVRAVIAWIYPTTTFRPFPILQHYDGFTPKLDRWTADFVRGPRAPRYVLYERFAIDARVDRWEPPETMLAMVCRYRFVTGDQQWQLFERRSRSACGQRRRIDLVEGRVGEEIFTPLGNDDEIVVGRFDGAAFSPGLVQRVRSLLSRPPIMDVFVAGDPNRRRFVTATSGQDHLLIMPTCLRDQLAGFDTATMRSLTFTQSRGRLVPGARIEAAFDAITFDCSA